MNRFHIIDKSCYRRREEMLMVRDLFLNSDWKEAGEVNKADVVLFMACAGLRCITDERLKEIADLKKQMNEGAELIVAGCLPGMFAEHLAASFQGKTITPTDFSALKKLPGLTVPVEAPAPMWGPGAVCRPIVKPSLAVAARMLIDGTALECLKVISRLRSSPDLKRAALRLQRRHTIGFSIAAGCARRCSYCAKPLASGPVRSKPLDAVVDTIRRGVQFGYRAFDLYADSIGNYGLDQEANFGILLDRILEVKGRFSVGLFDVHPQDFIRYFHHIERLCQARRLHYIYVAIQSGNEKILKLMKRPCDLEELAKKLTTIRKYEHVFMQSGIIAGFPGETDAQFEDTLRFLERVNFDDVYVHYYCDMPNSEASRFPHKVGRDAMLRRLAAVKRAEFKHTLADTQREWDSNLALPILQD